LVIAKKGINMNEETLKRLHRDIPTLSRICNKYKSLFGGYDSGLNHVQYFGKTHVLLEKTQDNSLNYIVEFRINPLNETLENIIKMIEEFKDLLIELKTHENEIIKEANEILTK